MNWFYLFENVLFGDPIDKAPPRPESTSSAEYAIWRLWQAKTDTPDAVFDHAILARQCIRWMEPHRVRGDRLTDEEKSRFRLCGIRLTLSGYLEVEPYYADWLGDAASRHALDALPQPGSIDESLPAEDWLQRVTGKLTWRSHAQKEACWAALTSHPGSTNLIGLPTGAGKSLVFQVAAAFSNGLTIVVVPTLALGLDQIAIAKTLPAAEILGPATYSSGDGAEAVRDAVAERRCRLLFTSPESCVSGRLRGVLDQHASDGWLQWVVIDEAHIVESWGADFRIEFQLLGALVRDWRERSSNRLRTLLLSATFAESTQNMLRGLFIEQGQPWKANVVQRLRPEINYHFQFAPSKELQTEWVTEALLHLPRPAILYVTEKVEARQWYQRTIQLGLKRVECFHGDTSERERNRIMDAWRANRVDLMVATSAFGMGVDKPDVRAVIHACFPESIDRFYQEVGRGGRDGSSMQSLLIHTARDERIGSLLAPTLLKPETVNDRWSALWDSRQSINDEGGLFQVRADARRQDFVGRRTYEENVRWNKRLLQMLHRARLLTITGLHRERLDEESQEYTEWVTIKGLRFPSFDADVGSRLTADRDKELSNIYRGFIALKSCIHGLPVCRELQRYYGGHVARACGSCRACRRGEEPKRICGPLQWPEDSVLTNPKVYVIPMPRIINQKGEADWIMAIRRTIDQGVANRFVVGKSDFTFAASIFRQAMGAAALRRCYRLDSPGSNQLPAVTPQDRVVALHLSEFQPSLGSFNLYGATCSHWMPKDDTADQNGRSRFTQDNAARLFDGFESWFFENQVSVAV